MENKKLTWKHYLGIAVVAVLVIYLVIDVYKRQIQHLTSKLKKLTESDL